MQKNSYCSVEAFSIAISVSAELTEHIAFPVTSPQWRGRHGGEGAERWWRRRARDSGHTRSVLTPEALG